MEISSVLLKVYLYHLYSLPIPVTLVFEKSQIQIFIKLVGIKTQLFWHSLGQVLSQLS